MSVSLSKNLRSLIVALDSKLINGRLRKKYYHFVSIKSLKSPFTHRMILGYNHKESLLHELFYKYGSDKGAPQDTAHPISLMPAHTYADLYYLLFNLSRNSILKVFECGLGTNNLSFKSNMGKAGLPGASLRAWRDYFPNAEIFGADIDSSILFSDERITTLYVDQTVCESIEAMWTKISVEDFDLIIDDGLHTFDAGKTLFESSIGKLRLGGIYVIEDINPTDKQKFYDYFNAQPYQFHMVDLHRPNTWLSDNSVAIIWK